MSPICTPTPPTATGRCTLVGAGPGDPQLLTLKALQCLQRAEVLLVDDLVNPDIVALANPACQVIRVGKRGGCKSTPQADIHQLIVTAVHNGQHVVRLKGGDPFIFGRGGEEIEHLHAAGIPVDVINGITAAMAAATTLGVPLTHRDRAQGVLFLTGHTQADGKQLDWAALAQMAHAARLTLVIYMGVRAARHIQAGLLQGLPSDTPVAIVHKTSLPDQRHAVCTLESLWQTLQSEHLGSPSVIVIGNVLQGLAVLQTTHNTPSTRFN